MCVIETLSCVGIWKITVKLVKYKTLRSKVLVVVILVVANSTTERHTPMLNSLSKLTKNRRLNELVVSLEYP